MYASHYTVIPSPRILTYSKCMVDNTCSIPLPGIPTYTKCMLVNTCSIPLPGIPTYTKYMLVNTCSIPLPEILTYTKYMLVYASNHTFHISFVNDDFTTRQFTQQPFTLITHTFSNSHFTSVIYIKSWNLT
jgi:hypothetical protein